MFQNINPIVSVVLQLLKPKLSVSKFYDKPLTVAELEDYNFQNAVLNST